eukprot:TRINITY_DN7956_c0_g1_i1.p1 TRINITY_DN7956_c0_g1~~TRINITY_DN7956_c0_g1_i1.p1  ORF type:complete len:100 (+),score=25.18 TRINITY_DN7956_c0_g1_i1:296-595(+)
MQVRGCVQLFFSVDTLAVSSNANVFTLFPEFSLSLSEELYIFQQPEMISQTTYFNDVPYKALHYCSKSNQESTIYAFLSSYSPYQFLFSYSTSSPRTLR